MQSRISSQAIPTYARQACLVTVLAHGLKVALTSGISGSPVMDKSRESYSDDIVRTTNTVTAFSNNSSNGPVFFACTSGQELVAINSQTGDLVRKSPAVSIYTHLVNGQNVLLSGASDGYIRSHDPRTSSTTVNAIQAHGSGIQGLLTSGSFIFTIGLGMR